MGSAIDLIGKKFNRLNVISRHGLNKENRTTWLCKCDCGNEKIVAGKQLISGNTKSCGCFRLEVLAGSKSINLLNKTFNRLTVIEKIGTKNGSVLWLCKCICGNNCEVITSNLTSGISKSCGCLQKEITTERSTTHGMSHYPEYQIWAAMKHRCYNINDVCYNDYGGRGISVCDRWLNSFELFYADMGPRPNNTFSINRINNNGNYEPSNCTWSSNKDQARNKTSTRYVTYKNKEMCMATLAEKENVNYDNLKYRLNTGMSAEEAVTLLKSQNIEVKNVYSL